MTWIDDSHLAAYAAAQRHEDVASDILGCTISTASGYGREMAFHVKQRDASIRPSCDSTPRIATRYPLEYPKPGRTDE